MITNIANEIISEDDKYITYKFNEPIYDSKGYPTWKYDDTNFQTVTIIKSPLLDIK